MLRGNDWEVWLRRTASASVGWVHLSGLIAVGGMLLFSLVIERRSPNAAPTSKASNLSDGRLRERSQAVVAAARRLLGVSLLGSLLQVTLELLDLAGSARDLIVDPSSVLAYLSTKSGQGAVIRGLLLGASLAFLGAWKRVAPATWPLWLIAGIQAVNLWTVSMASHAAAAAEAALLAVMLHWLHLLAATVWAGGLVALWRHAWTPKRSGRASLLAAMARFTPWAVGAILILLATGIYAVKLLAPQWWNLADSGYGRILLAKLTLVGAMVLLGMRNSFAAHPSWMARLTQAVPLIARWPRAIHSRRAIPTPRTRRWIAAEALAAGLVLSLAVLLSRTPPPKPALPPPPPPLSLEGPAGDMRMILTISSPSGWSAPSRFRIQLQDRWMPPEQVAGVTLLLAMSDMAMPVRPIVAEAVGPGEYEAEAFLSMLGRWQAQVTVQGRGRTNVRVLFDFGVTDSGPTADITAASHTRSDLAYHWSTLFLMAMPYVIVGTIGGWLAYMYRRTERERQ